MLSVPTAVPATATPATPILTSSVIIRPQTPPSQTNEQRWRAQEVNRRPFDPPVQYIAQQATTLLWYDPLTGQSLEIGTLLGEFPATAEFTLRSNQQPGLEVPYQINVDYGLTAISDAIVQRMRDAGASDRVEAFVLVSTAIKPK